MWCKFLNIYTGIKKTFFSLILLTDNNPSYTEKARMFFQLIITFAPVAYLLEVFKMWFYDNSTFLSFILVAVIINLVVGMYMHYKSKTFSWEIMLKKTGTMIFVLVVTYYLLEQIRIITGDNVFSDGFRITMQVATLFYPSSKALKNIYILSNREYPPSWIMEKVYNFEKTGDLNQFMKNNVNEMSKQTIETTLENNVIKEDIKQVKENSKDEYIE